MLWGVFALKSLFFKNLIFPNFRLIESVARPIETEKFSVFKFLTKFFFMHHLCLGFTCIAFFSVSILQFCSHISHCFHTTCRHFAKLGTQLDLKIDWLIFWAMYFLVYATFMCELQKIFFLRDMMDNQCANIFSTHATVYGSYSVKFAFIERENIFLYVYRQLSF